MNRYHLFLLLLFLTGGNHLINGQVSNFSEEALGFSPGEIRVIESPSLENIEAFIVPTFRDLLRLGYPRAYYNKKLDRMELANTGLQRKNLEFMLKDGLEIYFSLASMETAKNTMDLEKIRAAFRPGFALEDINAQYAKTIDSYWAIRLKEMGARHLKPESFEQYFCPDQEPCLPLHMPKSSGSYQQKLRQARWGGGQDEFAEMRAFNDFMDTQANQFVNWVDAVKLDEVYMVGRTSLREYDFNAGGFVLKGIKAVSTGPVFFEYTASPEESLFRPNYQPEGHSHATGILLPMSPEKGEALIKKLSSQNRGRQLYYVYKAKIIAHFSETDMANTNFHMMVHYTQEPVTRNIEFFTNDALTEKLFEISN